MRASAFGGSKPKTIRSLWRREVLTESATTSRRALHVTPLIYENEEGPAEPTENLLASKLQFYRSQLAAAPSTEALYQRLAVKPVKHTIKSLMPEKLSEADYVDLSGHSCQLNVARRFSRVPTVIPYRYQPFTPFRPGTAGFFYYTSSPALPQAGEIRFRITGSPRPESFALGRDLLTSNGLVWRLHLLTMLKGFDEYAPLVAKLKSDGLLTEETRASCARLMRGISILSNTERALHSHYQPFIFDFKNRKPKSLWFLTPDSLERVLLEDWLTQNGRYSLPTNGTVMLCAEPPQKQINSVDDSYSIVLRVLRIVRPVVYPRRSVQSRTEGEGDEEGGVGEEASQPPSRVADSSDGILRAYEGQLLSNSLGEPLKYVPMGRDWPSTWTVTKGRNKAK